MTISAADRNGPKGRAAVVYGRAPTCVHARCLLCGAVVEVPLKDLPAAAADELSDRSPPPLRSLEHLDLRCPLCEKVCEPRYGGASARHLFPGAASTRPQTWGWGSPCTPRGCLGKSVLSGLLLTFSHAAFPRSANSNRSAACSSLPPPLPRRGRRALRELRERRRARVVDARLEPVRKGVLTFTPAPGGFCPSPFGSPLILRPCRLMLGTRIRFPQVRSSS
ncbi:MAG: hypothetical protein BJ554DRAFT_4976 [Olpidium bornovanus]|uniref:Uncharacterized protein n=1 Tax=Olpidium bornovanus TaxID=278681 RepID=A0A8H8DEV4_9FUNG|nr:MAG: hypothetical protein BJ554DRAFT_4976 [Olpidium bornovanus]